MLAGDVLIGQGQHHAVDSAAVPDGGRRPWPVAGLIRPLVHALALTACDLACSVLPPPRDRRTTPFLGLAFSGRIGVAAGFDPGGRIGRRFGRLGFGCAEIGTITLQGGAGKPSLAQALCAAARHAPADAQTILGAVIGPQEGDAPSQAADGIISCIRALSPRVDYASLSLCATGGVLRLPVKDCLDLLRRVAEAWIGREPGSPPLLVKIPAGANSIMLAEAASRLGFAGLTVEGADAALINRLSRLLPVVAVGGIRQRQDVERALAAGAGLVQVCRGLITGGPRLAFRLCP